MSIRTVCVYGAGALGGAFATKIAHALSDEVQVSVIARGAQLAAIRENGLSVVYDGENHPSLSAHVTATDDPSTLPPQDLVITGMKGHQLSAAAEGIASLCNGKTRVMMILNGCRGGISMRTRTAGLPNSSCRSLIRTGGFGLSWTRDA
jgi:2-dehydropantoate 2-reductase